MQNLTEEQRAQVKFIEGLIRERNASRAAAGPAEASQYVSAALTCSVTNGPDGAHLEGWITYAPGNAVYFRSSEITLREGLPIAMAGAHPVMVLPPDRLMNKTGAFAAPGWGPAGTLQIKVDGVSLFPLDAVLAGLGLLSWRVEGKVAFGR